MISIKDLKDQSGLDEQDREFLYCEECGLEISGDARDYTLHSPTYAFTCCGKDMVLAKKEVHIHVVKR